MLIAEGANVHRYDFQSKNTELVLTGPRFANNATEISTDAALVAHQDSKRITVRNLHSKAIIAEFTTETSAELIRFTSQNDRLIVFHTDSFLVWDLGLGKNLANYALGKSYFNPYAAVSRDGKFLAFSTLKDATPVFV